ncbi:MAG: hypothetical protein ACLRPT_01620 [Akkermansia muciniphila]
MDSKITRLIEQASVIVGALPYLQAYRDKTFLIKFGGSAMDDARLVKSSCGTSFCWKSWASTP